MAKTAQDAYNDTLSHIQSQGGPLSNWYCGITSNISNRLFGDHNVPEENHWFIFRECVNSEAARAVEKALLDQGCDGGPGGGDNSSVYVYAYLKSNITKQ